MVVFVSSSRKFVVTRLSIKYAEGPPPPKRSALRNALSQGYSTLRLLGLLLTALYLVTFSILEAPTWLSHLS